MISLQELNPKNFKVTPEIQDNLNKLLVAINIVRKEWGKPMIVTSGLRDLEDHKRIYREQGVPEDKVPMGSKHLIGAAVDISDPDGKLFDWCKANQNILEQAGLWCEEKDNHPRVHFQIFPPKSGHRFFFP